MRGLVEPFVLSLIVVMMGSCMAQQTRVLSFSAVFPSYANHGVSPFATNAAPMGLNVRFTCQLSTTNVLDCWVSRPPRRYPALVTISVQPAVDSGSIELFSSEVAQFTANGDLHVNVGDVTPFMLGDLVVEARYAETARNTEVTFTTGPFDRVVKLAKFIETVALTRTDVNRDLTVSAVFTFSTAEKLGFSWKAPDTLVPGVQVFTAAHDYRNIQVVGFTQTAVIFAFECDTPLSDADSQPICGMNNLDTIPVDGVIDGNEFSISIVFDRNSAAAGR